MVILLGIDSKGCDNVSKFLNCFSCSCYLCGHSFAHIHLPPVTHWYGWPSLLDYLPIIIKNTMDLTLRKYHKAWDFLVGREVAITFSIPFIVKIKNRSQREGLICLCLCLFIFKILIPVSSSFQTLSVVEYKSKSDGYGKILASKLAEGRM